MTGTHFLHCVKCGEYSSVSRMHSDNEPYICKRCADKQIISEGGEPPRLRNSQVVVIGLNGVVQAFCPM